MMHDFISDTSKRVSRVGNPILASPAGVDIEGVTFLLNDAVLSDGVLFAFSAFFRSQTPVRDKVFLYRETGNMSSLVILNIFIHSSELLCLNPLTIVVAMPIQHYIMIH